MTSVLRINRASELLSCVPFQLGFVPQDSLVIISLRGPRRRVGLITRVDIEALFLPDSHAIDLMLAHAKSDGASAIVAVLYSNTPDLFTSLEAADNAQRAFRLVDAALDESVQFLEAWIVGDNEYSHWIMPDEVGHQPQCVALQIGDLEFGGGICSEHCGNPIEFESSSVSAAMVLEGHSVAGNREQLGLIPRATTEERKSAYEAYRQNTQARRATNSVDKRASWRTKVIELLISQITSCNCLGNPGHRCEVAVSARELGRIAAGLEDTLIRDAFIVLVTSLGATGGRRLIEIGNELERARQDRASARKLARISGHPSVGGPWLGAERVQKDEAERLESLDAELSSIAADAVDRIVDPRAAEAPDECVVGRALQLLSALLATAPSASLAGPRALMALSEWWRGNGALAHRHVEEGLKISPEYGLLRLVESALDRGLPPGWRRQDQIFTRLVDTH